jgi:hypothetical protein
VLFDLRTGKRRRLVQIVYGGLAVSFLLGFVIFGVGSGGIGSLSDLFGGGSGGSSSNPFSQQIDQAQQRVDKNPKDENALLSLARYHYLTGQSELEQPTSPTAPPTVTDASHAELVQAVDAWTKYLKVTDKPDPGVAGQIAQGYALLNDATGAAAAQEIFAKARPSQNSYGQLALYRYANGDIPGGDEAGKQAVALAPKSTRKQLEKQLASFSKQAKKFQKQQAAAAKAGAGSSGSQGIQNPFGGLGPTTGAPATTP